MTATTDNLLARMDLVEEAVNNLQTAINNLTSKKQNNAVFTVLQKQFNELTQQVNNVKALGADTHDHAGTTLASGVNIQDPVLTGTTEVFFPVTIAGGVAQMDASLRSVFYVPVDQNITTLSIQNLQDRKVYIYLKEDPTGGYTITTPATWKWPGSEPTWNTTAEKWSLIILSSPDKTDTVAIGFTE